MKVNGKAFKLARKKIREDTPKRGTKGLPAKGTQEWLAEKSGSSVRAIQYLEKGEASLETVDRVSPFLRLNGRELIFDYGREFVNCSAQGVIDLRPATYPPYRKDDFFNSSLMITLDPLTLEFESADIDNFKIRKISANLSFSGVNKNFKWIYEVALNPSGSGWLGVVNEINHLDIRTNLSPLRKDISIMLSCCDEETISWSDFIEAVDKSISKQANLSINIEFEFFSKEFLVFFSLPLLRILFDKGRNKRNSEFPYRASIDLIS